MYRELKDLYDTSKKIRKLKKEFIKANAVFLRKQADTLVNIQYADSKVQRSSVSSTVLSDTEWSEIKVSLFKELKELQYNWQQYQTDYLDKLNKLKE